MLHLNYRIKQFLLAGGDITSFSLGFLLAVTVRLFSFPTQDFIGRHLFLFAITFFFWVVLNFINGLYDVNAISNNRFFYRRLGETAVASLVVSIIFFYLVPNQTIAPKTILALNIFFGYGITALWRLGIHHLIGAATLQHSVLFVGYTQEFQELLDILKKGSKEYNVVAIIDPEEKWKSRHAPGDPEVYRTLATIRPAITNHKVELVVIAPHLHNDEHAIRELYELLFWSVQVTDLASFYEHITGRIPPSTFSEGWFLDHLRSTEHPIYDKFRTLIDYLAVLFFAPLTLVITPFVALAIKLDSKGPVFFKQKRVGLYGEHFTLYKFRSMIDVHPETEGSQFTQKNDSRVTRVGKILRKARVDELPQLWNILKRDITLIGPRPELPKTVKINTDRMPYYPLRHVVRPGITGWAVIHQHYTDNQEDSLKKLEWDLFYIKNRSLVLDLSILLRTVNVVVRFMGQ